MPASPAGGGAYPRPGRRRRRRARSGLGSGRGRGDGQPGGAAGLVVRVAVGEAGGRTAGRSLPGRLTVRVETATNALVQFGLYYTMTVAILTNN